MLLQKCPGSVDLEVHYGPRLRRPLFLASSVRFFLSFPLFEKLSHSSVDVYWCRIHRAQTGFQPDGNHHFPLKKRICQMGLNRLLRVYTNGTKS